MQRLRKFDYWLVSIIVKKMETYTTNQRWHAIDFEVPVISDEMKRVLPIDFSFNVRNIQSDSLLVAICHTVNQPDVKLCTYKKMTPEIQLDERMDRFHNSHVT